MAEYIERETAMDIVRRTSGDYAAAFTELRRLPPADVASVRHGRWIKRKTWNFHVCSECSFETPPYTSFMNYCPNCGATMDLED